VLKKTLVKIGKFAKIVKISIGICLAVVGALEEKPLWGNTRYQLLFDKLQSALINSRVLMKNLFL